MARIAAGDSRLTTLGDLGDTFGTTAKTQQGTGLALTATDLSVDK